MNLPVIKLASSLLAVITILAFGNRIFLELTRFVAFTVLGFASSTAIPVFKHEVVFVLALLSLTVTSAYLALFTRLFRKSIKPLDYLLVSLLTFVVLGLISDFLEKAGKYIWVF